jgi:hypothetical protein
MKQTSRQVFVQKWGELLSPELFQRIVLFIECAGFVKATANVGVDSNTGLEAFDLLDDALQAVLKQAASDRTLMGQAIWNAFNNPRAEQFTPILERKR